MKKTEDYRGPQPMTTVLSIDPLPAPSPLLSTGARSTASLASPSHLRQRSFTSGRFEVVDFDTDDSLADDSMFMESGACSTVSSIGSSTGLRASGVVGESSRVKDFKVSATVLPRYKSDVGLPSSGAPETSKGSAAPTRRSPRLRTALSVPINLIDDTVAEKSTTDIVGRFQVKDLSPDDVTLRSQIVSSRRGSLPIIKPPPVVKAASDPVKAAPRSTVPTVEISMHASVVEPMAKAIAKKKLVSRPSVECMCAVSSECTCKKYPTDGLISSAELLRKLESLAQEVEFLKTENLDLRKSVVTLQKEVATLKSSR